MSNSPIRQIWHHSYGDFCASGHFQSAVQWKASHAILNCKSAKLGCNVSRCSDCGHMEIHNNSCRNRNCPNCQAVLKEIWVDKRRAEVIDSPYFHVVFTLPHELNPLIYCNQKVSRSNSRNYPGSPHLEPGARLPCAHALHCFRRRTYQKSAAPEIFRQFFYPGQDSAG